MSKNTSNLIIGLLVLLSAFLGWKYTNLKNTNTVQINQITELNKVQAELDGEYQVALSSLENMKDDNQELNALIESQKLELKSQKSKISDLIWTKRELTKAKTEMENLNRLTNQYLAEINTIKRENANLLAANSELTSTNKTLVTSLDSEKQVSAELKQTRTRLMSENEVLSSTNQNLNEKVDAASAIKLSSVTFVAGSLKSDGSFKKRIREGRMEVFMTCLETEANVVTDAGTEAFQIRIMNQKGETLSENESDVLINRLNGEEVRYSTSGAMEYDNEESEACMTWSPPSKIKKGQYKVEVYNKGFKVGTDYFKI